MLDSRPMDPQEALAILERERARGFDLVVRAETPEAIRDAEIAVLGRKAPYSEVQRSLGSFGEEDRKAVGRVANEVRGALEAAIEARRAEMAAAEEARLLEADRVDVTLPGRRLRPGSLHPVTIVERQVVEIFTRMGYRVAEGPEIEDDWYNYASLNFPPDHPARSMHDTLYVDVPAHPGLLLRTHTSPVQIRTMQAQEPPLYVVIPGRCYRHEEVDPTHLAVFHQVEGLAIDEGLSFSDLKGTLEAFARAMFGPGQQVRLNPTYFPFVEPGAEVEVSCFKCGGEGCRVCGNGWIEILGAGMVHPVVLEAGGYDPERYTGFAFGLGTDRVAMLRYGIPDLRMLQDGDVRFLEAFAGAI